jgi:hypothetical protein
MWPRIGVVAPQERTSHAYELKRLVAKGFNDNCEIVIPIACPLRCVRSSARSARSMRRSTRRSQRRSSRRDGQAVDDLFPATGSRLRITDRQPEVALEMCVSRGAIGPVRCPKVDRLPEPAERYERRHESACLAGMPSEPLAFRI